jgi:hypothetical protein
VIGPFLFSEGVMRMAKKGFVVREWKNASSATLAEGTGVRYAVRDDGKILRNVGYGWKLCGELRPEVTLDDLDRWAEARGLIPVEPRVTWEAEQAHKYGVAYRWSSTERRTVPVRRRNIRFK